MPKAVSEEEAAVSAVEDAQRVLGGELRQRLKHALNWMQTSTAHARHARKTLEMMVMRLEEAHRDAKLEATQMREAYETTRARLDALKQQAGGNKPKLPPAIEDLIEDRHRLLERLGMTEYQWMSGGGVYFKRPPRR